MASRNDPHRRVGAQVHALAKAVTNFSECSRLDGVNSATVLVNGRVLEMIVVKTATGRSNTPLKVLWKLLEAEGGREKIPTLENWECQVRKCSLCIICSECRESPIFLICTPASTAYSSWIHSGMMALLWGDRERRFFGTAETNWPGTFERNYHGPSAASV